MPKRIMPLSLFSQDFLLFSLLSFFFCLNTKKQLDPSTSSEVINDTNCYNLIDWENIWLQLDHKSYLILIRKIAYSKKINICSFQAKTGWYVILKYREPIFPKNVFYFYFISNSIFRFRLKLLKGFLVFCLKVAYELLSIISAWSCFWWIHLIYKFECNGCINWLRINSVYKKLDFHWFKNVLLGLFSLLLSILFS